VEERVVAQFSYGYMHSKKKTPFEEGKVREEGKGMIISLPDNQ